MAGAAGRVPAGNQTDKVPCKIASVIQININGFPAWALIDSGADQSMVNENFASRAVGRDKLHQAHVERMTGAGGVPLTVCGQADISLEIKKNAIFPDHPGRQGPCLPSRAGQIFLLSVWNGAR